MATRRWHPQPPRAFWGFPGLLAAGLSLLLVAPGPAGAQVPLQPTSSHALQEIRATGPVILTAEVFLGGDPGSPWIEVRGEIRSGTGRPAVVEAGACPVTLVAYPDGDRTRAVWTGRPATAGEPGSGPAGCPDPDHRIRREVLPGRGHPFRQRFLMTGTGDGTGALPRGLLHLSVVTRVNGERRSWPAGTLRVDG